MEIVVVKDRNRNRPIGQSRGEKGRNGKANTCPADTQSHGKIVRAAGAFSLENLWIGAILLLKLELPIAVETWHNCE
jgi:hypothetical protein